ncbi:MAG: hypothetical protein ACFB15_32110 [Cyclobacteriaceae bacterium]
MSDTPERVWANEHTRGRIEEDPGPTFWLWNFAIEDDQPRREHIAFLAQAQFVNFLIRQFRMGHRIEVTGLASSSGGNRYNLNLSQRRAENIRQIILRVLQVLRSRQLIDPNLTNAQLNRSVTASGAGRSSIFLYRADDAIPVPIHEEGGQYANNRGVRIRPSQVGLLADDQVEVIGRAYLRRRIPSLSQNFRFWEMWTPTSDVIAQIVPRTLSESNPRRGSRVPPNRPWGNLRPGSRAMTEAGFVMGEFITLRWQLRNFQYNEREVRRQIDSFISTAESARNRNQQLEQTISRWLDRTAAAGGGSAIIPDMRRYLAFRNPVFLGDQTCMLKFNGFRPVQFRLPPPS